MPAIPSNWSMSRFRSSSGTFCFFRFRFAAMQNLHRNGQEEVMNKLTVCATPKFMYTSLNSLSSRTARAGLIFLLRIRSSIETYFFGVSVPVPPPHKPAVQTHESSVSDRHPRSSSPQTSSPPSRQLTRVCRPVRSALPYKRQKLRLLFVWYKYAMITFQSRRKNLLARKTS